LTGTSWVGGEGWRRSWITPPPWQHLRVGASSGSSFTVAKKRGDDVCYGKYLAKEEEDRDEDNDV
jgi:hypothetical protein